MGVSYHIGMRVVTHSQIALAAHQKLASFNAVDRARRTRQRHSFVYLSVVAHDRNTADLQAQPASLLWCAEQAGILAAVALWVLRHATFSAAKDADLECLLLRDQAAIIAAAAHDCRCCGCRHGRRERRRASAVVVPRLAGGDVVAVNCRVGVAGVRVQITADLGAGCCRQ